MLCVQDSISMLLGEMVSVRGVRVKAGGGSRESEERPSAASS